jgi:hypothetical protein
MDYDLYILVHPEQYPGDRAQELGMPHDDDDVDVAEDWYADQIRAGIALAGGRALLVTDDDLTMDIFEEQGRADLTGRLDSTEDGIELADVVYLEAPFNAEIAAKVLAPHAGLRVLVGGFHREDCVAKVIAGLKLLGATVELHCPSTLPQPGSMYLGAIS